MKIKNIFLFMSIIWAQSIFSARLTIYNETLKTQYVTIYTGSTIRTTTINPGAKQSIDSGFHRFESITWKDWQTNNKPYQASIPSSVTMLMGSIVLRPNGQYGINFDVHGASDKKVRESMGTLVR